MEITFRSFEEDLPGEAWRAHYERHQDAYRRWFLSEGDAARPSYLESVRALRRYMPELMPTYERLVDLAGGGDVAARLLALYRPPPYLTGCSQAVWPDREGAVLVRNYDYHPALLEGAVIHSGWNEHRVIALSDCLWGVLDGMNDAGLVVSLTFGGRRTVGEGFGIPLVLRYVLERCETAQEVSEVFERVPAHMAYNVTVLDRAGRFFTAHLAPDRATVVRQFPVATNHQSRVEWFEHASATATLEREQFLFARFADGEETRAGFVDAFSRVPLFSRSYSRGFGTLYTAVYDPGEGALELRWPGVVWRQSFQDFRCGERTVGYRDETPPLTTRRPRPAPGRRRRGI